MTPPTHRMEYLDTPTAVEHLTASIAGVRQLALDTEGASYHRFVDRIYLLQLSTRDRTVVMDPLAIGVPQGLGALLEDPAVEVVFHDADYDLRLLAQDYQWHVRSIFDTRIAAQLLGIRAFGLAALLESYFGIRLEKKHQRADWSMRPLTADMLAYAAQDTMHLLPLRDRLSEELGRAGRLAWAQEEFQLLEGTKWDAAGADDAFLRMKGARDLNRRELGILRELVRWRDDVARRADKATFRVIGNEQLLQLARLKPTTSEALAIKGVSRSLLEHRSADMLDAVRRGLETPEAQLPRFPRPLRWQRDTDFDARASALRTVRDTMAAALNLDPGVLCSRDRLEAVARRNPRTIDELSEVPGLRRWQVSTLGAQFVSVLEHHRGPADPGNAPGLVEESGEDSPYRNG